MGSVGSPSGGLPVEAILFSQPSARSISASPPTGAAPESGLFSFTLQQVGGAAFSLFGGNGDQQRGIAWQVENGATGALQLIEFSASVGPLQQPLNIEFPQQLFPGVAFVPVDASTVAVLGITASGLLFYCDLVEGALHSLTPEKLRYVDISAHWASLGTPTCLVGTPEHIVIGGSNGPVACVPLAWLREAGSVGAAAVAPTTPKPFELRESSWGLRSLIAGVWQRSRSPSVISVSHLEHASGKAGMALVTYDDCTVRGFSLAKHTQLFTETLQLDAAARGTTAPTYATAIAESGGSAGGALLVVQFESQDNLFKTAAAYQLAPGSGGRLAVKQHWDLQVPPNATMVGAHASPDSIWVLLKAPGGASQLLAFSRAAGGKAKGGAVLVEAGLHLPAVAGAGSGNADAALLALWEGALAAAQPTEGDSGSQALASAASDQVLARLLAPDSLCRASLRDALAYHGAQMTVVEAETVTLAQLGVYVNSTVQTIQRRNPSLSPVCCWAQLLDSYQQAWARRHPLLALAHHPAHPSWLATVRGGSMLCALRPVAPVEALGAASSAPAGTAPALAAGLPPMPADVAAVAKAAQELAGLLGPLALDAFVSQVAAGAASLRQLVSHYTRLLLEGPAAASMGQDDVARSQHSVWRQRRQRALLQLGQSLGSLPDPAASIRQYSLLLGLQPGSSNGGSAQAPKRSASTPAPSSTSSSAASGPSWAASTFLATSTRQLAYAQVSAARDVLLLLGVVEHMRALGPVALDAAQLARLHPGLSSEVSEVLHRGALAYWLSSCNATAVDLSSQADPTLHALAHLQLGGSGRPQPVPPSLRSTAPQDVSLASALLPTLAPSLASCTMTQPMAELTAAVLALVVSIQYGDSGNGSTGAAANSGAPAAGKENAAGGSNTPLRSGSPMKRAREAGAGGSGGLVSGPVPLSSRVLQLGYALFLAREYPALAGLTQLARAQAAAGAAALSGGLLTPPGSGPASFSGLRASEHEAAGADFLRGLSLACRLGSVQGAKARAAAVTEAAGCFFRAAASLASESGAGGSSSSSSNVVGPGAPLRQLLAALRQQLLGCEPEPASVAQAAGRSKQQEAALLQLQACEAAMMLFEREGAPDGAVLFARAALQYVPPAYGHLHESQGHETAAGAAGAAGLKAVHAREGRLWSNVFTYCCELGAWADAYSALVSNPVPQRALDCLRVLLHELSERGEVATLCGLPLAGALVVPGPGAGAVAAADANGNGGNSSSSSSSRPVVVSLLAEATAALQRRALNADLSAQPQPYKVLYSFLVGRCDYKGAAAAMLAYARRLRRDGAPTLATTQQALAAYEAAINALSLMDDHDAWLDDSGDAWLRAHALPGPAPPPLFPAAAAATSSVLGQGDTAGALGGALAIPLTLEGLRRECALLKGAAVVAASGMGTSTNPLHAAHSTEEVLSGLLAAGQVDEALALTRAAWTQGSPGRVAALERCVGTLAGAAARAQLQQSTGSLGLLSEGPGAGSGPFSLPALAHDPAAREALLGASCFGSAAAPLWARLRSLLEAEAGGAGEVAGAAAAGALRVAAADAILRVDRRLALPLWLLRLFTPDVEPSAAAPGTGGTGAAAAPSSSGGMAAAACGPAALLDVYLGHDRLKEACGLVVAQLEAWGRADPRARKRHAAAWFPHARIEALRGRLLVDVERGRPGATGLLTALDAAMQAHLALAAHDTPTPGMSSGPVPMLALQGPGASAWA